MLERVNQEADVAAVDAVVAESPTPPASFDGFLETIAARAFRFAELALRQREDALDAVQDAMARMLAYRDRPAAEWPPLFWRILRTRVVDLQRRRTFRLRRMVQNSGGHSAAGRCAYLRTSLNIASWTASSASSASPRWASATR